MNAAPAPPCGRLLEDKHLQGPALIALQVRRPEMNPFVLKTRAEQLLTEIWRQQNACAASQTGDATTGENAPPPRPPRKRAGTASACAPPEPASTCALIKINPTSGVMNFESTTPPPEAPPVSF